MTLQTPLYQQPDVGDSDIEYSALDVRVGLLASLFSQEGVLDVDGGALQVSQRSAGANFSVDIAAGRCAIDGDDISDQGVYFCNSTATENIATPSAPGSGTRTHRVVARVRDKLHNGSETTYDWVLEVLEDDGSGLPALPGSAIHLATVSIAAGQASVTDAHITNAPTRARVGTPARTGLITPATGWEAPDASRQPSYSITLDNWVLLSGWIRRSGSGFTAQNNTFYEFAHIPDAILPPSSRDMPGASSTTMSRFFLDATDSTLYFTYFEEPRTVTQNATWHSLDGCAYRLD